MVRMMKSFVMKRVGEVDAMGKEVPEPGPNNAIVKTTTLIYTGLCPGSAERMKRLLLICVDDKMLRRGAQGTTPVLVYRSVDKSTPADEWAGRRKSDIRTLRWTCLS